MPKQRIAWFGLVAVLLTFGAACKPEVTGEPLENIPPVVRLPNSMADSMYLPSTALIRWIGDDPDGIVVGYSYRVDDGRWRHEADIDGDWIAANDRNGNGQPDRNWDGGFGLLGVDDDGDNRMSAFPDSSRYYGYLLYADEELPNGLDDDGDGRIDEDCWGNDANRDGDCGYDPEQGVDEDPVDGEDNDGDGLVDEDPVVRPRWVRAMGRGGEWTYWSSATQDTIRFPATRGPAGDVHRFQVKCLDNQKAESAPRTLVVITTTFLPTPEILAGPADGQNVFMGPDTSGSWKGLRYRLGGTDVHRDAYYNILEDGRVTKWAYWLDNPTYRPPREAFKPIPEAVLFNVPDGPHTLYVQCMDNSGSVSDSIVSRSFVASNLTFARDVLLVDNTYRPFPGNWNETALYEGTLLAGKDVQRVTVPQQNPHSVVLRPADVAPFKVIYWYKAGGEQDSVLHMHRSLLADYLSLGGKVVLEGTKLMTNAFTYSLPATFAQGSFPYDYLGLAGAAEPGGYAFRGAQPVASGYPALRLKAGSFPQGAMPYTTTFTPAPAADLLYRIDSPDTLVSGCPNAVRLSTPGGSGKALVFGFPFLYLEPADQAALAAPLRADLGL